MTNSKTKINQIFKTLKKYLINDEKIHWKRACLVYLLFIPLMLLLEFALHLLPLEIYDFKNQNFEDIDLTDIYYTSKEFNEKKHKKDILLVNIGDVKRDDLRVKMPEMIDFLINHGAKKIGVDIRFDGAKKDTVSDNILIECLQQFKNKIVVGKNHQDLLFGKNLDSLKISTGLLIMPDKENRTVRKYYNAVQFKKGATIHSFANLLVDEKSTLDKDSIFYLKYSTTERGYYNALKPNKLKDSIQIDFPAIESNDLLKNPKKLDILIRNKIVIVGLLANGTMEYNPNDIEDKFRVPNNSDLLFREKTMPGMVVHANAVQMLLDFKEKEFKNYEHLQLEIILWVALFCLFLVLVIVEKIKPFGLRFLIEISLLITICLFFIGVSVELMESNIHLQLHKLLIYLPILVEFKVFLYQLYEYLEKINLKKTIKAWKKNISY